MGSKKGIASLLLVFIVTMIAVFVVLVWESRMLLIVHRSQGLADTLAAEYNAETVVNDILSRFLGGYPIPESGTKTLEDGTVMTTEVTNVGDVDTLSVTAKRQFATSKMQLSRSKSQQVASTFDKVEIVLGVDCTGSMDNHANPACSGGGCTSRIAAAKQSVLSFLDNALALPPDEKDKYFIGVETFKVGARWLSQPTNDLVGLRQQVADGFGNRISLSSACVVPDPGSPGSGETSLGNATLFADEYFSTTAQPRIKQIYVLVTDGLPNVSLTDARCGTINCRSGDGGVCTPQAINYLTCGVANTQTEWAPGYRGQRDPGVDVYGVTVISAPANRGEQTAYEATVSIFSNTNYVKKYFNSENAENLPEILNDIFGEITRDVYQFTIQRVVPTLAF